MTDTGTIAGCCSATPPLLLLRPPALMLSLPLLPPSAAATVLLGASTALGCSDVGVTRLTPGRDLRNMLYVSSESETY